MLRKLSSLAVLVCLMSCSTTTTEVIPIGDLSFAPRPADHPILLYTDPAQIDRPFVQIAVVQFTKSSGSSGLVWRALSAMTEEDQQEALKAKAREVGADAIVLGQSDVRVTGANVSSNSINLKTKESTVAAAIRFTDGD
jgi:uncharacterized protein YbjQ (UPF0145 family)